MRKLLKKILPKELFLVYHYFTAIFATLYYRFPAKKMIIIGITGTKGKTSTANFIWTCLTAGGYKTGIISTANIRIGEKEYLNKYHMTMPGRFVIQKLMDEMVRSGCKFCIIETTSEGLKQYRHVGVYYDIAVFTNLSPEHLPSHSGSFEKYKIAKGKMFKALSSHKKTINGKEIKKIIIVNNDDECANYFLKFKAYNKITFAVKNKADYIANNIKETSDGVTFSIKKAVFEVSILGKFNVYNVLPAVIICHIFGISDKLIAEGLVKLKTIPGRMEKIEEGKNFTVLVDYAHEGKSMNAAVSTARNLVNNQGKVIVILGAEGGGRDKKKRSTMGKIVGELTDIVIVSTVDPYDDDPKEISEDIALSVEQTGKNRGKDLFVISDRREAIKKAILLAEKDDVVIITGKGSEQSMHLYKKVVEWDDRKVVREEIKSLLF